MNRVIYSHEEELLCFNLKPDGLERALQRGTFTTPRSIAVYQKETAYFLNGSGSIVLVDDRLNETAKFSVSNDVKEAPPRLFCESAIGYGLFPCTGSSLILLKLREKKKKTLKEAAGETARIHYGVYNGHTKELATISRLTPAEPGRIRTIDYRNKEPVVTLADDSLAAATKDRPKVRRWTSLSWSSTGQYLLAGALVEGEWRNYPHVFVIARDKVSKDLEVKSFYKVRFSSMQEISLIKRVKNSNLFLACGVGSCFVGLFDEFNGEVEATYCLKRLHSGMIWDAIVTDDSFLFSSPSDNFLSEVRFAKAD